MIFSLLLSTVILSNLEGLDGTTEFLYVELLILEIMAIFGFEPGADGLVWSLNLVSEGYLLFSLFSLSIDYLLATERLL